MSRLYTMLIKVGVIGFEPTTLCSQSRCASQTALHPVYVVLKTNGLVQPCKQCRDYEPSCFNQPANATGLFKLLQRVFTNEKAYFRAVLARSCRIQSNQPGPICLISHFVLDSNCPIRPAVRFMQLVLTNRHRSIVPGFCQTRDCSESGS